MKTLHETQAIAAKHLDTMRNQKKIVLCKFSFQQGHSPEKFLDDSKINEQIERVLQPQQRNADSLRNFLMKDLGRRKGWRKTFSGDQRLLRFTLIQIANPFDQFIESQGKIQNHRTNCYTSSKNLFRKVWDAHTVGTLTNGQTQLFVTGGLIHEVTSPQALGCCWKGITVRFRREHLPQLITLH